MASLTRTRLLTATIPALYAFLAACSSGPASDRAAAASGWADTSVDVVSKPVSGAGVTAVTGLRKDGALETSVFDLTRGKRLWSRPATMVGRVPGLGVQPPAVAGAGGTAVVVAVEPQKQDGANATLVARDARTGQQKWTRPVDSTFGPVRCGPYVCLSEFTARKNARFVALDPATGHGVWRTPGIGEVEWNDEAESRVVMFRMAQHPTVESREVTTGKTLWSFPVEQALGSGVNLSGGWAFGSLGDTLVGYLAPYQAKMGKRLSTFGFFGLRLADGRQLWARPRMLRVYPSANPAVALITREIDPSGKYGGFAQLDPRSGQTTAQIPADKAPQSAWWLAFPPDLSALGFLSKNHGGVAYDLRGTNPVPLKGRASWSFCTVAPAPLPIQGRPGFYPVASLCAYDLSTGERIGNPGPPPGWYTGAADGWRVWRDENGALHGIHDAKGTSPGMYG